MESCETGGIDADCCFELKKQILTDEIDDPVAQYKPIAWTTRIFKSTELYLQQYCQKTTGQDTNKPCMLVSNC